MDYWYRYQEALSTMYISDIINRADRNKWGWIKDLSKVSIYGSKAGVSKPHLIVVVCVYDVTAVGSNRKHLFGRLVKGQLCVSTLTSQCFYSWKVGQRICCGSQGSWQGTSPPQHIHACSTRVAKHSYILWMVSGAISTYNIIIIIIMITHSSNLFLLHLTASVSTNTSIICHVALLTHYYPNSENIEDAKSD